MKLPRETLSRPRSFSTAEAAWDYVAGNLQAQYDVDPRAPVRTDQGRRAGQPHPRLLSEIRVESKSFQRVDPHLPYGFLHSPGVYKTTITAPHLFRSYLIKQFGLILKHYDTAIEIGESDTPIPLHFASIQAKRIDGAAIDALGVPLRDIFDVPDLTNTDDEIANGTQIPNAGGPLSALGVHGAAYRLFALPVEPLHRNRGPSTSRIS